MFAGVPWPLCKYIISNKTPSRGHIQYHSLLLESLLVRTLVSELENGTNASIPASVHLISTGSSTYPLPWFKMPPLLHVNCWVLCFLARLFPWCKISCPFFFLARLTHEQNALFRLHGITCCQAVWFFRTQSSRSSKSLNALVCSHSFLKTISTHSDVMQVTFVWLVICSRSSSSSIRIDGSPIGRITELCIHILCDVEYPFSSCNYLCYNAYQPLY